MIMIMMITMVGPRASSVPVMQKQRQWRFQPFRRDSVDLSIKDFYFMPFLVPSLKTYTPGHHIKKKFYFMPQIYRESTSGA